VILGDSFGLEVAAEDDLGYVDPSYSGTVTLSLSSNPGGAKFSPATTTADSGVAVFDGVALNELGTGYVFQVSSDQFPTISTDPVSVTTNPTPWAGTFYPVPTDASLRNAILTADSNSDMTNTILLFDATYVITDTSLGALLVDNDSSLPAKTLVIEGQGESSTIIEPGVNPWNDRIFEVTSTSAAQMTVILQNLTISGGDAAGGLSSASTTAQGGGLLVNGGAVFLTDVMLDHNRASGAAGAKGSAGGFGKAGGDGKSGDAGQGGAIYLASGSLTLNHDTIAQNVATGGAGGAGGTGGTGKTTQTSRAVIGGGGGNGATGGSAAGGGVYVAGGQLLVADGTFSTNQAVGGAGGAGGTAGGGGLHKRGGIGGNGAAAGAASGGAIYLAGGSVNVVATTVQDNSAIGGGGGAGGSGGLGGGSIKTSGSIGSILGGSGTFARYKPGKIGSASTVIAFDTRSSQGYGGSGGDGARGAPGSGGGVFVEGGSLTLTSITLEGNKAIGGAGGAGGKGGIGGFKAPTGGESIPLPMGEPGGQGGNGGDAALGSGGGLYVSAGTVTVFDATLSTNSAVGGAGGAGGQGGSGPIAAVFGLGGSLGGGTGITTGFGTGSTGFPTSLGGGGTGINTGGPGGNGGSGATGQGGGAYIAGGTVTLVNDTLAADIAQVGAAGAAGKGGPAGTGKLTGGAGVAGSAGVAGGGGMYVSGGTVSLLNSTLADNLVDTAPPATGTSSGGNGTSAGSPGSLGGGLDVFGGSVTLESTLVGLNTSGTTASSVADDIVGTVSSDSSYNLIGTGGSGGLTSSDHNQVDISSLGLGSLAANGGLTETIALQAGSPAIGNGANPDNLFADERGFGVGPGTHWDVGAYQTTASVDSTAPTLTVQAVSVSSANAGTLNPYTFSLTFSDNVAVANVTLPGAVAQVDPPGGAPITATLLTTTPVGPTDALGDAAQFVATYQITPPGGAWTAADNGTYSINMSSGVITDLAGNAVADGAVGSFSVQITTATLVVTTQPPNPETAGDPFTLKVAVENSQGQIETGYTGSASLSLQETNGAVLNGNLTAQVASGVFTFPNLSVDVAAEGYSISVSSSGLATVSTSSFNVVAAAASQLVVSTQPSGTVVAGQEFDVAITAEDPYDNVAASFSGPISLALKSNPGNDKLQGTVSLTPSAGVANFSTLVLIRAADGYTIQATTTTSGVSSALTNAFDVTAAPASQLVITSQPPGTVTAGTAFGITVTAEDPYNNVATDDTGSIALALESNPGNATLGGSASMTPTLGVASFKGLLVDTAAQGYTIEATSQGLASATSVSFNVVAAAAYQLAVTTQPPPSVTVGSQFGLTISVEDQYGNLVTSQTGSVTISLDNNPGKGRLSGERQANLRKGVAVFRGLSLNKPGKGYTIQGTKSGLVTAITNPFNVTAAKHSVRQEIKLLRRGAVQHNLR
jgi:hypothetical protein